MRGLYNQKGLELYEGHAKRDHIHLLLSIPPKFSVSNAVGFVKGKIASRSHRELLGKKNDWATLAFWATGYCVSTLGLHEDRISKYTCGQDDMGK